VASPLPIQSFPVDVVGPWLEQHPEHLDTSPREFLDAVIAEHPEDYWRMRFALGKT
jgi:hypothetical protein